MEISLFKNADTLWGFSGRGQLIVRVDLIQYHGKRISKLGIQSRVNVDLIIRIFHDRNICKLL